MPDHFPYDDVSITAIKVVQVTAVTTWVSVRLYPLFFALFQADKCICSCRFFWQPCRYVSRHLGSHVFWFVAVWPDGCSKASKFEGNLPWCCSPYDKELWLRLWVHFTRHYIISGCPADSLHIPLSLSLTIPDCCLLIWGCGFSWTLSRSVTLIGLAGLGLANFRWWSEVKILGNL